LAEDFLMTTMGLLYRVASSLPRVFAIVRTKRTVIEYDIKAAPADMFGPS
jgi:hypothetical protein